jgi:hypothetical protein
VCEVRLRVEGDTPPDPGLYDCAYELEGEPHDEVRARNCLQKLLASGYFAGGELLTSRKDKRLEITYVMKALPLIVTDLAFDQAPGSVEAWLTAKQGILKRGEAYDFFRNLETKRLIEDFFEAQGRTVIVSSIVTLDYAGASAGVRYRMVEGPKKRRTLPHPYSRYEPECELVLRDIDFSAVDRTVPLNALESRFLRTQPLSCFLPRLIDDEVDYYRKTGLFDEADYSVHRIESRVVSVSLRAKSQAFRVRAVTVEIHGPAPKPGLTKDVLFKAGEVYDRFDSERARLALVRDLSNSRLKVDVYEEVRPSEQGTVEVVFHILAGPPDETYINGRQVMQRTQEQKRKTCPPEN